MINSTHQQLLMALSDRPMSQSALADTLGVSRSRINQCYKTLERLGLVETLASNKKIGNMVVIKSDLIFVAIINLTCWDTSINIYDIANLHQPAMTLSYQFDDTLNSLLDRTFERIQAAFQSTGLTFTVLKAIHIITQGTMSQELGVVYRSNAFNMTNVDLKSAFEQRFGAPVTVSNISYCEMLALVKHAQTPSFVLIAAGRGCVGMGVAINGQVLLGDSGHFLECRQLPYDGDLEHDLGYAGKNNLQALIFLLRSLVPMFNTKKVYLTGETFEHHFELYSLARMEIEQKYAYVLPDIELDAFPDAELRIKEKAAEQAANVAIYNINDDTKDSLIKYVNKMWRK
ncbi:ROK family protein [Vibrio mediterranei]